MNTKAFLMPVLGKSFGN
jgi:hypothetical protein